MVKFVPVQPASTVVEVHPIDERQSTGALAAGVSGSAWAFSMMVTTAAIQALARNKMRSALTMLGVFIGVAALIAMVAVGQGANEAVRRQIESLDTNLTVVVPGATMMGGLQGGLGSASTLTVNDAQAIRREAPAVGNVSYLIRQMGQVQYANQNWSTNIQGVSLIRQSPIGKLPPAVKSRRRTTTAQL